MPDVSDEVFEGSVGVLEGLCAISSASGDLEGIRRVADALAGHLRLHALDTEIHEERGRDGRLEPVLVARHGAGSDGYLLLIGHLDTVLPAVEPRRTGHRMDGTGALDMKGGFAALVGALELNRLRGVPPPGNAVLVAVPDEEVGGPISETAVREWGAGARSVLVLEPGELRGDAESLVTGRRGLVGWRLRARGTASHAGLAYWEGRSALAAAAEWSGGVQRLSEPGRGPTVNVGRILGGDAEFVDEVAEHHTLLGTSSRLNIVADRCLVEGEIRFLTEADRDRMLEEMAASAETIGGLRDVAMKLEVFETIPPVDPTGPGRRLADRLVDRAAEAGWRLELEEDRGGVSFPNFLPDPGEVAVLDGLGPVGGGMHTRSEFLDLRSLRRRIGLLADLFREVGG